MKSEGSGLAGGCQCGAVRYRIDSAPFNGNVCHCRMCQKAGGAPFMAFASVPRDKFVITHGRLSTYASSDIAERGFCAACGTPLTYQGKSSAHTSFTIGSLDDPNATAPRSQLGVESRVDWLADSLASPAITTDQWLARNKIAAIANHQHPDHEI